MLIGRLAETLVAKEKASGLTRKAFAKHLGLPESSYRVIVGGDAKVTLERVALLAAALQVSEFEILGVVPTQSASEDLELLTSVRSARDLR
jgi:transcriptional regulator with XRE-family HTH domain